MDSSDPQQSVCLIGLGLMGSALGEALLRRRRPVTVWNRTATKCAPLAEAGATVAQSAAEAVAAATTVVVCVLDHAASMAVLDQADVRAALRGKTVIQLTTMSDEQVRQDAKWVREHGGSYVGGAILAYPADVRNGTARMVFACPKSTFEAQKATIDALAARAVHVADKPEAASAAASLVYQLFYGITYAFLHTAALSQVAGIDLPSFGELVNQDEEWDFRARKMRQFLDMTARRDYVDENGATLDVYASAYATLVDSFEKTGIDNRFPLLINDTLTRSIERGHRSDEIAAIFEILVGKQS